MHHGLFTCEAIESRHQIQELSAMIRLMAQFAKQVA